MTKVAMWWAINAKQTLEPIFYTKTINSRRLKKSKAVLLPPCWLQGIAHVTEVIISMISTVG
jgi:hypothetical protein